MVIEYTWVDEDYLHELCDPGGSDFDSNSSALVPQQVDGVSSTASGPTMGTATVCRHVRSLPVWTKEQRRLDARHMCRPDLRPPSANQVEERA
ncbi:uncharacterized protein [Panulirus ornatus]|uniref:uncharacterized protein isoform X2 n=1 Tax=Panulirus ornatus TaxID=150431 RepID=UPI003A89DAEE